ncbi:YggT family protein [Hydrogenimonas sp.]
MISAFIYALVNVVHTIINIYIWIVIISALVSWVRPDPYNPIVQTLYKLTEPVYAWIRRYIPTVIGGVDLAPLIVIIGLQFIDVFLMRLVFG